MIKEIYSLYVDRWRFFLSLTGEHLQISLISIVVAAVIGLGLGILISLYRKSSSTVLGLTNFIYTIPSIALFGFLIPFSGIGNTTAIIALSIYALLPMVHNTYTGIAGIDREIIEAARGMGSTTFQILYKIQIPLAFPVILSGIRNMVVMTIALTGIAAFIGAGRTGCCHLPGHHHQQLGDDHCRQLAHRRARLAGGLGRGTLREIHKKKTVN